MVFPLRIVSGWFKTFLMLLKSQKKKKKLTTSKFTHAHLGVELRPRGKTYHHCQAWPLNSTVENSNPTARRALTFHSWSHYTVSGCCTPGNTLNSVSPSCKCSFGWEPGTRVTETGSDPQAVKQLMVSFRERAIKIIALKFLLLRKDQDSWYLWWRKWMSGSVKEKSLEEEVHLRCKDPNQPLSSVNNSELSDHKDWTRWLSMSLGNMCLGSESTLINPTETEVYHFGHDAKMHQTGSWKRVNKEEKNTNWLQRGVCPCMTWWREVSFLPQHISPHVLQQRFSFLKTMTSLLTPGNSHSHSYHLISYEVIRFAATESHRNTSFS